MLDIEALQRRGVIVDYAIVSLPDPIDSAVMDDTETLWGHLIHAKFSVESMAALLELDPSLVRVMLLPSGDKELRILLVRLETSIRDSMLGRDLISSLEPMIGTGAIMVWAFSVGGAEFSPWNFYITQGGRNYVFLSPASFVELTGGFVHVERVEEGKIVASVIRLPTAMDGALPFFIYFETARAGFP